MSSTPRINWQYGVNYDGVERYMTTAEVKQTIVQNPANAHLAHRIQVMDEKYVRKAVGKAFGWHRRKGPRSAPRQKPAPAQSKPTPVATAPTTPSKVTFHIGGCTITVPRGVSINVDF